MSRRDEIIEDLRDDGLPYRKAIGWASRIEALEVDRRRLRAETEGDNEASGVRYKPQIFGAHRTMEQVAYLLAGSARRVWRLWCSSRDEVPAKQIAGRDSTFDDAMRGLARRLKMTDTFFGGVHAGREEDR